MTWLGLNPSTITKVSVDIFGRLTQHSQTAKAKSVYLKDLLEFGAWDLFPRLGLTRFTRLTQPSQGQRAKPSNLVVASFNFLNNIKQA
ncbi:hypothetical protein [uncultured Eudoraea sp.]|uniref:hypothetical protein n=1 Tax=uncultured Eudoraea sp. TaxID=1035614 RepID=UPI00262CD6A3|nr:hypothetical protein [uncultured Eudoraea sp.]